MIPVTVDYGDGTLETMSSEEYANRWVCAAGHAVAVDDVEVVGGRTVGRCVLCDRQEVPIEFVAAPPELRTRRPEPVAARWRCAGCGGFVSGGSVTLDRGHPFGTCDRCAGGPVPVLYERTDGHGPDVDERPVGVDPSLLDYRAVARDSFLDVIRRLPSGERFSANTLRSRLDALEVPPAKRGRLFGEAVRLELARPLFVESGVLRVRALEASTGRSAKHAGVKLYERTDTT